MLTLDQSETEGRAEGSLCSRQSLHDTLTKCHFPFRETIYKSLFLKVIVLEYHYCGRDDIIVVWTLDCLLGTQLCVLGPDYPPECLTLT